MTRSGGESGGSGAGDSPDSVANPQVRHGFGYGSVMLPKPGAGRGQGALSLWMPGA